MAKLDDRTEKNIATLAPLAQVWARAFVEKVRAAGIDARIISGSRTYEEQDDLYAIGRTKAGHIVTNAKGGQSNHNFGIAWDIGIFKGKEYLDESALYDKAGVIGRDMGLEWGGDWHSIMDKPHFQCKVGLSMDQLRKLHNQGKPVPIPHYSDPNVVTIWRNDVQTDIPAMLISDRTFVGVRRFVEVFGGELVSAGGSPFIAVVRHDGADKPIQGQIVAGAGYVKFADLNSLYRLHYVFDSANSKLSITAP